MMRVKDWSELSIWQKLKVYWWLKNQFDKWQEQVLLLDQMDEFEMTETDRKIRSTNLLIIAYFVRQYNSEMTDGELLQFMYRYLHDSVSNAFISSVDAAIYTEYYCDLRNDYLKLGLLE